MHALQKILAEMALTKAEEQIRLAKQLLASVQPPPPPSPSPKPPNSWRRF